MEKDVSKKTGVIFLIIAIFLAIIVTLGILNYIRTPKVGEFESKESTSSGEITLIVQKPPIIKDESTGRVSLVVQRADKK